MQEQINIKSHPTLEQVHVLMIGELSREKTIHGYLGARAGDLDAAFAAFDEEDADFVAGYGEVDLFPFAIVCSFPGDEDAFVGERACRVFEGAKFWFTS